jgi:hypothetical protein
MPEMNGEVTSRQQVSSTQLKIQKKNDATEMQQSQRIIKSTATTP